MFRRAQSLCALPPNKSLLPAPPYSLLATVWRFWQLSGARYCHLRFVAQLRHTSTAQLASIEFALGPRPPQPRAASF